MKRLIPLFTFLMVISIRVYASKHKKEISQMSQRLGIAIKNEDTSQLASIFSENATLLPEYHPSLPGKRLIRSYYIDFFNKTQTLNSTKESFEIQQLNADFYIELGTFTHHYVIQEKDTFQYNGKYTTYWQIMDNKPKIVAHIWGASSYFESNMVDFVFINTPYNEKITPESEWEKTIEERRAFAYKAVFDADADTQMETYHKDAIYMTYYDPPFIGKEKVAEYFRTHYNPEVPKDSLDTRIVKVIELGDYALKFGEYYVAWTWENEQYFIRGKGLTLFKKDKNGSVSIYRQMINHSMPAMLLKDENKYLVERTLRHLDNQELKIEDYLSVYHDEAQVLPPGNTYISGKENFQSFLSGERENGSIEITHKAIDIETRENMVIVAGGSEGTFVPTNDPELVYPFTTNNLIVFEKLANGQLLIKKLIWNNAE